MYYFLVTVRPKAGSVWERKSLGRFRAECWIAFPRRGGAEAIARHYTDESGWVIEEVHAVGQVDAWGAPDHPEFRSNNREILGDGYFIEYLDPGAAPWYPTGPPDPPPRTRPPWEPDETEQAGG